jgi:hypothetical protein
LIGCNACRLQTICDSVPGKIVIMFLAGKSLFLSRRDNLPIGQNTCGRIMIVSRNSENGHSSLSFTCDVEADMMSYFV